MASLLRGLNSIRKDLWHIAFGPKNTRANAYQKKSGVKVFSAPAKRQYLTPSMALATRPLRVLAVIQETAQAASFELAANDGHDIDFTPGMFLTVVCRIDGQEYRRAYSISSAVQARRSVTITVKRVVDGMVSNYLIDTVKAGDSLQVLGPSGNFALLPAAGAERELLLVGGGSGITPLMSILRSVLVAEPASRITLLYGNRRQEDVIFAPALAALEQDFHPRLRLVHVLEEAGKGWPFATGRLDAARFADELQAIYGEGLPTGLHVYMCGPAPMMAGVNEVLAQRNFPAAQVHQENFTPGNRPADSTGQTEQPLTVRRRGQHWEGIAQQGKTLLEAGLDVGAPMEFSCTLGGCGRCRVKVVEGKVDMPEPNCLLPEEKAQGYALACIAHACSPVTIDIDPPASN